MSRRTVIALGIGQCINWGVLYYAFAVLVLPLRRELGVDTWVVTGAFSLALLMSAMLAPRVGAWCDRGGGPIVMQAGGLAGSLLLIVWTMVPGVAALYLIWGALGLCMAMTLYEPAFAIVGRAYDDPSKRLRALAAVTLFGGLASTVFLPLTAFLVATWGWRRAVLVLAAALIASSAIGRTFRPAHPRARGDIPGRAAALDASGLVDGPPWLLITGMFAIASLASAAFAANLVPALTERGISASSAAVLGGVIGVMQLPGRALLMHGGLDAKPTRLLTLSLGLQAIGLGGVAVASTVLAAAAGTALFALGAGLITLVRPHLVQSVIGGAGGYLNGRMARQQQLARAAGPLAVAWIAGTISYSAVFAGIAALFVVIGVAAQGQLRGLGAIHTSDQAA
ncbi:MAG TPA: MFS transporter [Steroidobacteraceae bacterium]|nr:MFS transporter [Steroidobacteraceae bacterium]